ncbi:MAG: phospholipase D-like domain-containing protein [Acidobacteriota bacterium]
MTTRTANRKTASPMAVDPALPVVTNDFVEDTFTRVTGASLVHGNEVKLLINAEANYPAWLEAIRSAEERIYFESYIIHGDEQGDIFADALIDRAKSSVDVKLIYDWLGGLGKTPRRFWRRLAAEGIEVRCYNPPKLSDPLGVFSRDHRKVLTVDGQIAFVSGLCVGQDWVGYPAKDIQPWRDTGVQLRGPAVADVESAFAEVWATMGEPLPSEAIARRSNINEAGSISLRVIQTVPGQGHVYRADHLLASVARETMWLTDAYFVGVPSYLQSMKDASRDGVDVRILVPRSTDIALIRDTTRSTYRPLLEAGVRVFEWNGPMVHAKSAVFDGRFARIGSTNLNIASWFSNYEIDVLVEDRDFAVLVEEMFLNDLADSTEIVLADTARMPRHRRTGERKEKRTGGGSVRKATAGALNAATSISSAIAKRSPLGPAESRLLFIAGFSLLMLALLFIVFPRAASIPLIILLLMLALPTLFKAAQNYRNN